MLTTSPPFRRRAARVSSQSVNTVFKGVPSPSVGRLQPAHIDGDEVRVPVLGGVLEFGDERFPSKRRRPGHGGIITFGAR